MRSSISHKIKHRNKSNDVFITPPELAIKCIKRHSIVEGELWLDSCKNSGSFYNNFPLSVKKDYCEILEGIDFLKYDKKVAVISQNPPYSLLKKWFPKCCEITTREFGLLIGINNLTAKRIEDCNKKGFYLKSYVMFKVFKWYGMSCYVIFSNEIYKNVIDIDRKVYR